MLLTGVLVPEWLKSFNFRKPVSCHLYPVRLAKIGDTEAVNYHKWPICSPALDAGTREGISLYVFLKDALIRRYGEQWYAKLVAEIENREN